jgi:hypothetical protein
MLLLSLVPWLWVTVTKLDCSTPIAMTMTFGNVSLQFPCWLDNSQNTKPGISTSNNRKWETGLLVSCFMACYVTHSTRRTERGRQPPSSCSRPNTDMQMSNTNICASQMRTADAQLCEASSGMLFLERNKTNKMHKLVRRLIYYCSITPTFFGPLVEAIIRES